MLQKKLLAMQSLLQAAPIEKWKMGSALVHSPFLCVVEPM